MAAGWPTKVTYANGDVYSASDVNDTNGTLNYINPTAATDRQVLTRDNASGGKVKWVDSPANTLTTTGDLYYASGANTPARLGIGTAGQYLTVSGGVPAWGSSAGGMTVLASGSLSGALTLSSISGSYKDLRLILVSAQAATASNINTTFNSVVTNYNFAWFNISATPTLTGSTGGAAFAAGATAITGTTTAYSDITFPNYSSSGTFIRKYFGLGGTAAAGQGWIVGTCSAVTSAITSISIANVFTGGTYILYGVS